MDRSLYPSGVLVDSVALNRTELTKAAEILRNRTSWTTGGVLSGGAVTVNGAVNTTIDIAVFSGFTPNGEYVENILGDETQQPLASNVLGVVNYVLAVYTENNTGNQSHETDGYSYPTKAEADYNLVILTEAQYNALPDSDTILANNAKDRVLILAKVTGTGGALSSSNIESPTAFNNVLYTSPVELSTISGVTVRGVSSGTASGAGTLSFDDSGLPTYSFTWTPYGAAGPGVATTLTTDGIYTVTDVGGSEYITIEVVVSQLPIVGGATNEIITVSNLYDQTIPRISAEDHLHRNYVGTGIVTPNNPHATSFDDLYGGASGTLQEHQDVQHCNGIWKESSSAVFRGNVIAVVGATPDDLVVTSPSNTDLYYINGRKLNGLSPNSITFSHGAYGTGHDLYEIYVDDDEVLRTHNRASVVYGPTRNVTGVWLVNMSKDHPAGAYVLGCNVVGTVYSFSWGGGSTVSIDNSTYVSGTDPQIQIIRLFDSTGNNWVDLCVNREPTAVTDAGLPGGPTSDTVNVSAPLDYDQNMIIISAPYWYDADATKGTIGYRDDYTSVAVTNRSVVDRRSWGTICTDQISNTALDHIAYYPQDELHFSGILSRRNGDFREFDFSSSGLSLTVKGGISYCRGKRLDVPEKTLALVDAKTYVIYVDYLGVIQSLDIANFGSDVENAIKFIIGDSILRPTYQDSEYIQDDFIYAEQGVPLWVITTSGAVVSDSYDISRNINGPVDPWSVANRGLGLASFDNFTAAFHYADIYKSLIGFDHNSIDIKLVGRVVMDRDITQPSHVKVSGVTNSNDAYVDLNYSVSGDAAWTLSPRSVVDNIRFYNQVVGNVLFAPASSSLIKNCLFRHGTNDYYYILKGDSAPASTISKLVIDSCIFELDGGSLFDDVSSHTTNYEDLKFINNSATVSDATDYLTTDPYIQFGKLDGAIISGNYIWKKNGDSGESPALYVYDSENFVITNNIIEVSEGDDQITIKKGISIESSDYFTISSNTISKRTIATDSESDLGIELLDCSYYSVTTNSVNNFYRGISSYWDTYSIYNVTISNNTISGHNNILGASWDMDYGISVQVIGVSVTNLKNIDISNNNIFGLYKETNTDLYGIKFSLNSSLTSADGITVEGNNLSSFTNNTASGELIGIYFDSAFGTLSSHVFSNVSISNNSLSDFTTSVSCTVKGIYIVPISKVGSNCIYTNFRVDNNSIYYINSTTVAGSGESKALHLKMDGTNPGVFGNSSFSGNNIYVVNTTAVAQDHDSEGIYIEDSISFSNIDNNVINTSQTCMILTGENCSSSGNNLVSQKEGAFLSSYNNSSFSDSVIRVISKDVHYSFAGTLGSYCVFCSTCDYVVLSNIDTYLYDTNNDGSGAIRGYSSNIHIVSNCSSYTIQNCQTHQYYTSVTVGVCYHIYVGPGHTGNSTINSCIINNDNISGSHGLYIDGAVGTYSGFTRIGNNIFYTRHEDDGIAPAPTYFEIYDDYTGSDGFLLYVGNHICISNPTLPLTTIFPARSTNNTLVTFPTNTTSNTEDGYSTGTYYLRGW